MWIYQLHKLGYPAYLANTLWRPLAAGFAMGLVLYAVRDSAVILQIGGAIFSLLLYVYGLFVLRTFSREEVRQAQEGISFVSPFVASWAKKLRPDS